MTPSADSLAQDPLVRRLRAAGCVFAEDEARLLASEASDAEQLEAMVARRESGVPLEVVLGWAEFGGLRISLDPGVFVPRRRTEFLAQRAVAQAHPGAVVVELCCGAGAISAVLLANVEGLQVHASDIDPLAVGCARRNLAGPGVSVYEGDLFKPLPDRLRGQVDLVVANAPYVPTAELGLLPREARQYEPQSALEGGGDGLEILRRIMAEAPQWLAAGAHVLVEASERQVASLEQSIAGYGLSPQTFRSPEMEATVVTATMPATMPAEGGRQPA
jgi:release factor glutamine methyltransferase